MTPDRFFPRGSLRTLSALAVNAGELSAVEHPNIKGNSTANVSELRPSSGADDGSRSNHHGCLVGSESVGQHVEVIRLPDDRVSKLSRLEAPHVTLHANGPGGVDGNSCQNLGRGHAELQ